MGHFYVGKKRKFGGFLKEVFGKWGLIPFYRKNWVLVDFEVHSLSITSEIEWAMIDAEKTYVVL